MYNKALLAVFATILTALVPAVTAGLTTALVINVVIQAVTAANVFWGPNTPSSPVTKTVLAVTGAVLVAATSFLTGGIVPAEWIQIAIAGLGAAGVYAVANKPEVVEAPA